MFTRDRDDGLVVGIALTLLCVIALTTSGGGPSVSTGDLSEAPAARQTPADVVEGFHLPPAQEENLDLAQGLNHFLDDKSLPETERLMKATEAAIEDRRTKAQQATLDQALIDPLNAQSENLELSRALLDIEEDGERLDRSKAFQIARVALEDRSKRLSHAPHSVPSTTVVPAASPILESGLTQQTAALDAGKDMIERIGERSDNGGAETAWEAARRISQHQADSLGFTHGTPAVPKHTSPIQAAKALADRHNIKPSSEELGKLRELDATPEPIRTALADLLEAFLSFETATQEAYVDGNLTHLIGLAGSARDPAPWGGTLMGGNLGAGPYGSAVSFGDHQMDMLFAPDGKGAKWTGSGPPRSSIPPSRALPDGMEAGDLDLGEVIAARGKVLDAVVDLQAAWEGPASAEAAPTRVLIPPALAIDLGEEENVYGDDYAFLLDVGGNDTYENNAGGSNLNEGDCTLTEPRQAAALIDLGGNDDYASQRSCGVNGGGYAGSGFLFDAGGDDTYHSGTTPANSLETYRRATQPSALTAVASGEDTRSDRFIVGYEVDPDLQPGSSFHNATVIKTVPGLGFFVVEAEDPSTFPATAGLDGNVKYVEPDGRVQTAGFAPDDPLYEQQYGPQQVKAPGAWGVTLGNPSRSACFVDTGVRYTHEDLDGPRWLGGHDFVNDDEDPMDDNGHGTHVAGIAAATMNNGKGIAGLGDVGFMAAKVLDTNGRGFISDIAEGILWCSEEGADVVSLSFETRTDYQALAEAVQNAWKTGSLVVASAGNLGCYGCVLYPAAYDQAVAVTCTDTNGDRCAFSSYGPNAELAGPGGEILSTWHTSDDAYVSLNGTSASAPHVAGLATLIWSHADNLNNTQLRQLLRDYAQTPPTEGCSAGVGYGIADANATLQAAREGERPAYEGFEGCYRLQGSWGANGGAAVGGLGFLLDLGGNDRYVGSGFGANGGGASLGAGLLVDASGSDGYAGGDRGVNGGGASGSGALIDLGGRDRYVGGSFGINGGGSITPNAPGGQYFTHGVGLLFDGDGSDKFLADRAGVNGGGGIGTGTLLDIGTSDDVYRATSAAVNGGSQIRSVALLVDTGGNDTYRSKGSGANGGSIYQSIGFLVDQRGADVFEGTIAGVNGGTYHGFRVPDGMGPFGFLYAGGNGSDLYAANAGYVNGAGGKGAGFLLDAGGDDQYGEKTFQESFGPAAGSNGAGDDGTGFLLDRGGDDRFVGGVMTNGGSRTHGVGMLLNVGGEDTYEGTYMGVNGGAIEDSAGFLLDSGGKDTYRATGRPVYGIGSRGANGGGYDGGAGFLLDADGADEYVARSDGANGGAAKQSIGFLADLAGDDTYHGGDPALVEGSGTNGGAVDKSTGFLLDASGDDLYRAGGPGVNGGTVSPESLLEIPDFVFVVPGVGRVSSCQEAERMGLANSCTLTLQRFEEPSTGLLLDLAGRDRYDDLDGGRGEDRSRVPKQPGGHQLDLPYDPQLGPPGTPSAPDNVTTIDRFNPRGAESWGQPREITLRWGAPLDTGGSAIIGYRIVEQRPGGGSVPIANLTEDERVYTVRDLSYLEERTYEIRAINEEGEGSAAQIEARAPRCGQRGPDASSYTCAEVPFDWLDTANGTSVAMPDENQVGSEPISLPFDFPWYGAVVENVRINWEGIACLGGGVCPDVSLHLPQAPPNGFVACSGKSWAEHVDHPAQIMYDTFGQAPNRTFVISWLNVLPSASTGDPQEGLETFQLQLTEDGIARCMVEQAHMGSYDCCGFIGTENHDGTTGLVYRVSHFDGSKIGVRFGPVPNLVVANATASATEVETGEAVSFVDESYSRDGVIVDRAWDFGDGTTSSAEEVKHRFGEPGTYTVTLEVSDDVGEVARDEVTVTVRG